MNTIFNEDGLLNIEDLVYNHPSFRKIIEDGIVTSEELKEQSIRVTRSLRDFESNASEEQIDRLRNILAEVSVLVAARQLYESQHRA